MPRNERSGWAAVTGWCLTTIEALVGRFRSRMRGWEGMPSMSRTTPLTSRQVGALGEKMGTWYLARRGYEILETNWWAPGRRGELDIVAYRNNTLIAVEVRSYLTGQMQPIDVLSSDKKRRLVRLLKQYAKLRRYHHCHLQVDLLAVEWERLGKVTNVRHIEKVATEHDG